MINTVSTRNSLWVPASILNRVGIVLFRMLPCRNPSTGQLRFALYHRSRAGVFLKATEPAQHLSAEQGYLRTWNVPSLFYLVNDRLFNYDFRLIFYCVNQESE